MIISGTKTQISRRDFHIIRSVHCELNYKFYRHQHMHYSGYCVFSINFLLHVSSWSPSSGNLHQWNQNTQQ